MAVYIFIIAGLMLAIEMLLLAYETPKGAILPDAAVTVERGDNFLGARTVPLLISCGNDPAFIPGTYTFNF